MGAFISFYRDQVTQMPSPQQVYASLLSHPPTHKQIDRHTDTEFLCDSLFPVLPALYKTSL